MPSTNRFRAKRCYKRQKGICHWCGMRIVKGVNPLSILALTLDHLSMKNGERREAVAAHRICNSTRGHATAPPLDSVERVRRALELIDSQLSVKP